MQVNSLRLKSNVASKWASKHLWGAINFAVDGTWIELLKLDVFLFLFEMFKNIRDSYNKVEENLQF